MIYSLFEFVERATLETFGTFIEQPYMHELCSAVEDLVLGNLPDGKKNLVVNIPPRHYKTTFLSQCFPAWCLAEIAPDCKFILTSATSTLSTMNAMACNKIIKSEWYQELYPHVAIGKSEKDTQNNFETTEGGTVYAQGLGGTITGFGAGNTRPFFGGCIIIDDPMKAIDAKSETMIEKCKSYYTSVLKSRRNSDDTPVILIMQRLHDQDLTGFVMKEEEDDWHQVLFQAIPDENNPTSVLNPITTSYKSLMKLKEVDPFTYYAQYQQTPQKTGGNIIKDTWWSFYDLSVEKHSRSNFTFLTADTAFKATKKADRSVVACWEASQHKLRLVDAIYGRWEFPELLENALEFWKKWHKEGAREFWIEDKASGTPLSQVLEQKGIPAEGWKPSDFDFPDDKVARMRSSSFTIHGGAVYLPTGEKEYTLSTGETIYVAEHSYELIEEAKLFAEDMTHAHDDFCDVTSMAISIWLYNGGKPKEINNE